MAALANVALTNTFDTWRLRTNALLTRVNQFTINESALYANTLTANVSFTSKGLATMQGRATVGTNLTVSGNTTLGAANKVANVTGWFGVTGRATVSTNLFVAGNTTIGGALNINGGINLGDAATDLLTVTGRATIGQNLTVSGNTTLGAANKLISTTGLLAHTGRATISTNLAVSGNSTVTGLLTASGRATVGTNLTVSGNTVIGAANKTANVTGWFGVAGRATVSTNLFVGGNTTLNGTTTDKSNALSQTLTDGATINWDTALGRVATVTLGGNRTIAAATNQKVGTYILRVVQDGTGGRTLTWNGNYKWTAQTAPVLSTAIGAVDIITFFSDGSKMYGSYLPDMR